MMTSKVKQYKEAYVWIWLPGAIKPVVAGVLTPENSVLLFNYGQSYLGNKKAISLFEAELPLQQGALPLLNGLALPNCIRDASPDAWGRRVIINKTMGLKQKDIDPVELDELTYLLESGSDRIGALDFQQSPDTYVARQANNATLAELLESAQRVEDGVPLTPELDQALNHGSSIGGARPKALIEDNEHKYIAKFSSISDTYSVVKAEYIAMKLASMTGLNVAPVMLRKVSGKDVLLIERFDRKLTDQGWIRKQMLSALTLLKLDEMMARYASYETLAEIIRYQFSDSKAALKELYSRIVFNILCGNNDDHARNHAAFWDGKMLSLTPAYDICPQGRTGNETAQAMLIYGNNRTSKVSTCVAAASLFLLSENEAKEIADKQRQIIVDNWQAVCDEAELTEVDRRLFWQRQFLNPYAFED
jgi:serine/threonine-protein kinase HipA